MTNDTPSLSYPLPTEQWLRETLPCGHPVSALVRQPYIAGVVDVLYCGMCVEKKTKVLSTEEPNVFDY